MDRLYLLRHGIAVPHGTEGIEDDKRPLTSQGQRRMRAIARGLKELDIKLDRILTSPLPRAAKTAEIVADVLDVAEIVEVVDALRADQDAGSILEYLKQRDERRVMIVGHNPSFTDLVGLLVTGKTGAPIANLRKGGIAAFSSQPEGTWQLDWLSRPRLFRKLG